MDEMGLVSVGAGPDAFRRILTTDAPIWEQAIRDGGISLD